MATYSPVWVLPDEPLPVRLMNTIWADRHGVHDALARAGDLTAFLNDTGLTQQAAAVAAAEFSSARALRDSLRRLAAARTGDEREAAASAVTDISEAVDLVNVTVVTGAVRPQLRLDAGGLHRSNTTPSSAVAAALSTIAADGIDLLVGPRSTDLRACPAPNCVLYFVKDHPRRDWCSVGCGNRARAARHYRRHRGARP